MSKFSLFTVTIQCKSNPKASNAERESESPLPLPADTQNVTSPNDNGEPAASASSKGQHVGNEHADSTLDVSHVEPSSETSNSPQEVVDSSPTDSVTTSPEQSHSNGTSSLADPDIRKSPTQFSISSSAPATISNSPSQTTISATEKKDGRNSILNEEDINYLETLSKEMLLDEILKKYKIKNNTWIKSHDGASLLATFMVESGRKEEDVLDSLLACGIGKESGSTIGISPLSVCLGGADVKKVKTLRDDAETTPATDKNSTKIGTTPSPALSSSKPADSAARVGFEPTTETSEESENLLCKAAADDSEADLEQDGESEFMKSVKARIVIQPVMASLKKNAEFTFDYLLFIILASVISAIGLIENNSVILVASMLISPLMGPILAATFGAVVKDRGLQNVGIKSELIGLALCVCTGFLIGLPVVFLVTTEGPVLPSTLSWPAPEMFNRGLPRSLVTGIIIAFVSGMAVALSVLGDNQGSLVGVAISASLLPPAVNAGLLWAYSFRSAIVLPETVMPTHPTSLNITSNSSTLMENNKLGGLQCPDLVSNTYSPQFSCNMAQETFYLGLFSLLLTILNIIMIVIAAVCCLKVKQVSPRASVQGEKSFWTEHMVVAKHYNTTIRPDTDIWKALKQDMKTELGLSDKDVERLDDAGDRSAAHSQKRIDMIDQLFREAKANAKTLQRANSVPSDKLEQRSRLPRLMSHEPKLETEEFQNIKKSGRFQIIRKQDQPKPSTTVKKSPDENSSELVA